MPINQAPHSLLFSYITFPVFMLLSDRFCLGYYIMSKNWFCAAKSRRYYTIEQKCLLARAFLRSRQYQVRPTGPAKASLLGFAQQNHEDIIPPFPGKSKQFFLTKFEIFFSRYLIIICPATRKAARAVPYARSGAVCFLFIKF